MLSSRLWKYIAPTSLGAAYAITKMLAMRALDSELAIAQDFTYQFLAGILLGFALRPVTNQIYWKRTTSILFFSLFLMILGPVGQLLRHRIWGIPFDDTFWLLLFTEIITAFVVSILAIRLLGNIVDKLTRLLAFGIISRILGSIFGFFKVIVIFSFLLFVLTEYELITPQIQKESVLLNPIQDVSVFIIPKINKHKNKVLNTIEKNTEKAKEEIDKKVNPQ